MEGLPQYNTPPTLAKLCSINTQSHTKPVDHRLTYRLKTDNTTQISLLYSGLLCYLATTIRRTHIVDWTRDHCSGSHNMPRALKPLNCTNSGNPVGESYLSHLNFSGEKNVAIFTLSSKAHVYHNSSFVPPPAPLSTRLPFSYLKRNAQRKHRVM